MHPFYGKEIDPDSEQIKIQKILSEYRHMPVSEDLKKIIHSKLSEAKACGDITIPFKIIMRKEVPGKHRAYIEVVLDTKV